MLILAAITQSGTPQTGLDPVPTLRIRDLSDNSLAVTDAAMTEVGDGWYKYDFTTYSAEKDYAIRVDAGAAFADIDRYYYSTDFAKSSLLTASRRIVNNTLEFYTSNGVILSFDLKDKNGDAGSVNIYDAQ